MTTRDADRPRLTHDQRIVALVVAASAPAAGTALFMLWTGDYTPKVQWTLTLAIVLTTLGCAASARTRVVTPLQTVSNLLAALREGDFSIRGRPDAGGDALGDVMREVNLLTETLHEQRLGALEATALLRKVMAEIDVAVFTFDGDDRLQLVNRAGERLLGQPEERLLGKRADVLRLDDCLRPGPSSTRSITFPGGSGRWEIRVTPFRQHGRPHQLLVLTDVTRPLREEELRAWQRLIRVLGHELNNSLAPIKSIAGSLETLIQRDPLPHDWRDDATCGLAIIASRADALGRFTTAYARLARLPPPAFQPVEIEPFVRRVAALETRREVQVAPGPAAMVRADVAQLEQALINLVRNAVDAVADTGGSVRIGWHRPPGVAASIELWVDDEGPGVSNPANLFVPFFTTKPTGSGIGLVLSRQIVDGHGGTVTLENRSDGPGCRATVRLPL